MPNKKSAIKELRKSVKRAASRQKVEDDLKKLIKDSRSAIAGKSDKAKDLVTKTLKAIDKAAQKGIIKKNTRDRNKSRLQVRLNKGK